MVIYVFSICTFKTMLFLLKLQYKNYECLKQMHFALYFIA